ncbi:hypothetical protein [Conservatibacter flavescens]|uniref:Uncharacterized protein n=1 Tax=Conservatibacter flavescens TaxID=28161 RepID=A0A2M8S2M0_9PAST|nr:hypothetical protein [Conservatibacter flavescens]PJG85393.1 hypothetical protein CVP05_06615 [Conservatibacter flavescens]
MRSFLLEYTQRSKDENETEPKIDIHVNLWKLTNSINANLIFDFGLMIEDITNIKNIILYCPFQIDNVKDLGGDMSKAPDLIEAIFNENCEIITNIHPNRVKITKKGDDFKSKDKTDEFILSHLENDLISFKNLDEYGRIEINVENILSGNEIKYVQIKDIKKYYFRIRVVSNNNLSHIVKRENESINILQDSSLRTTEIIDFRINDFRSINEKIKEEVLRLNTFDINSIHYLIMRNATDEFISSISNYKSRLLEKEVWNKYISVENKDIIAYHFKKAQKKILLSIHLLIYLDLSIL